jgi:hypothetical protein
MNIKTATCNLTFVVNTISLLRIVGTNLDWSHGRKSACHATVVNVDLSRQYHGDHGGQSMMNI